MELKRIITDTDLDGLISAFLIRKIFPEIKTVIFKRPWMMGSVEIKEGDIILDLPYKKPASVHFDHHTTSYFLNPTLQGTIPGNHDPTAKSTARTIINEYIQLQQYKELVKEVDKIDSGELTKEDFQNPTPLGKMSMALTSGNLKRDIKIKFEILKMLEQGKTPEEIAKTEMVNRRVKKKMEIIENTINKLTPEKITKYGINFLIVDTTKLKQVMKSLSSHLCLKNPKTDITIITKKPNWKNRNSVAISISENRFKTTNKIKLGKLVEKYGGKGNDKHGGFTIQTKDAQKTTEELIEQIATLNRI